MHIYVYDACIDKVGATAAKLQFMVWGSRGSRGSQGSRGSGAPGAPETLKLQVDRRSEMVWFAKGDEINILDFCITNTKDIICQL